MMMISKLAVQSAGLGGETTLSGGFPLQKQAAREGRLSARAALFSTSQSRVPAAMGRQECWGTREGTMRPRLRHDVHLCFSSFST